MTANIRFYVVHKDGSFTEYNADLEPLILGIVEDQHLASLAAGDRVTFDKPNEANRSLHSP